MLLSRDGAVLVPKRQTGLVFPLLFFCYFPPFKKPLAPERKCVGGGHVVRTKTGLHPIAKAVECYLIRCIAAVTTLHSMNLLQPPPPLAQSPQESAQVIVHCGAVGLEAFPLPPQSQ